MAAALSCYRHCQQEQEPPWVRPGQRQEPELQQGQAGRQEPGQRQVRAERQEPEQQQRELREQVQVRQEPEHRHHRP